MSFLNNLGGLLSQFSGAAPEQVQSAAADHVAGMDAGQLAGHLADSAQNLDSGELGRLATSLLGALSNHGHDEAAIGDAGVSTSAAQAGDQNSVTALIEHAQQNPAALKDAALDFIKNNPQAVQQLGPDFLERHSLQVCRLKEMAQNRRSMSVSGVGSRQRLIGGGAPGSGRRSVFGTR